MRASRLVSFLMVLQTRGQLTAEELADRLEVSERTVQRNWEKARIYLHRAIATASPTA